MRVSVRNARQVPLLAFGALVALFLSLGPYSLVASSHSPYEPRQQAGGIIVVDGQGVVRQCDLSTPVKERETAAPRSRLEQCQRIVSPAK